MSATDPLLDGPPPLRPDAFTIDGYSHHITGEHALLIVFYDRGEEIARMFLHPFGAVSLAGALSEAGITAANHGHFN